MTSSEKVIKLFNEEFGSDLKSLSKLQEFQEKLVNRKNEVEKSLSIASSEATSQIKLAVDQTNEICNCIDELKIEFNDLHKLIVQRCKENEKDNEIQNHMDKIKQLNKASAYLSFIKDLENISNDLEASVSNGDDEIAVALYLNLVDKNDHIVSSQCHHLTNYMRDTLHYWYNYLKDKMSKEYNDILKALKWPFCGANVSVLHNPSLETITRFKILTDYLLQLQLPEASEKPTITSSLLAEFPAVCLPISLLVKPLRQRFQYHFTGSKQTNRPDKPEWFFTQILTWIKDHSDWVHKNVQPIADNLGLRATKFKVEFMRALVQLAVEKLHTELQIVQFDDALFAHLIDEALGFERELRDSLLYPPSQPGAMFVITQAHIFVKWINMEKKYAAEKMDAILSSESAWERLPGFKNDDMKVTECTEAFLTLLQTISDRYNRLPQPGHRLQFLELQLELIDEWRVRLLQLTHQNYEDPLESLMPKILNTYHYVSCVLMEWGETVHYLQLYFFKKKFENIKHANDRNDETADETTNKEEGSVFDESVTLLQRLEAELIAEICVSVLLDVKAKSRNYRTDKWFAMQSEKEVASLSMAPSGFAMFQELSSRLHALHTALACPLFTKAWKYLATELDKYLVEEVVLVNQFNSGGAAQFRHDIYRNLFPLFGIYTENPELHFPLLREACILLNMLLGSAMLLLETLDSSEDDSIVAVLADVGVVKITPYDAMTILKNRTDISAQ